MIRRLRSGGPRQLICLPFAGGAAHMYRPLAEAMPDGWEVVAVDAPGHGSSPGPLPANFDELASAQERAVVAVARPPYVLFGHSLGGWVAYHIASRLAESALVPSAIVLSGCRPPNGVDASTPPSTAPDLELIDFLKRVNGTDERLLADREFRDYLLPLLRSDLKAGETFVLPDRSALAIAALLLVGTNDDVASRTAAAQWRVHLPLATVHEISGGHLFVVTAPSATAAALRALEAGSFLLRST